MCCPVVCHIKLREHVLIASCLKDKSDKDEVEELPSVPSKTGSLRRSGSLSSSLKKKEKKAPKQTLKKTIKVSLSPWVPILPSQTRIVP